MVSLSESPVKREAVPNIAAAFALASDVGFCTPMAQPPSIRTASLAIVLLQL